MKTTTSRPKNVVAPSYTMPDYRGLRYSEFCQRHAISSPFRLKWQAQRSSLGDQGHATIVRQQPAPGTRLDSEHDFEITVEGVPLSAQLPRFFQKLDSASFDAFLAVFQERFQFLDGQLKAQAAAVLDISDQDRLKAWLDRLAWPELEPWPALIQRRFLASSSRLLAQKGTLAGLTGLLTALRPEADFEIREPCPKPALRLNGEARLGIDARVFEHSRGAALLILIENSDAALEQRQKQALLHLLKRFVPAHVELRLLIGPLPPETP